MSKICMPFAIYGYDLENYECRIIPGLNEGSPWSIITYEIQDEGVGEIFAENESIISNKQQAF